MSDHWEGCWSIHPGCAVAELRRVQVENARLRSGLVEPDWMAALRNGPIPYCDTVTGPVLTHGVVLKLHGAGPLHSHCNDEPPCR